MAEKATAKEISKAFETLFYACGDIQDLKACDNCPMRFLCFDGETGINEMADLVSTSAWQEFLDYAENASPSEEDMRAVYEDNRRKAAIEQEMIDKEAL